MDYRSLFKKLADFIELRFGVYLDSCLGFVHNLENIKKIWFEFKKFKKLLRQLQLKNELQLDNDSKVYWRITSEKKEGPFCSTCYGAESKLIPLHYNGEESWYCSKCKANFQTKKKWQEQRRKCLGLDPQ